VYVEVHPVASSCGRAGMGESPLSELHPYPRLNIVVSAERSIGRDV